MPPLPPIAVRRAADTDPTPHRPAIRPPADVVIRRPDLLRHAPRSAQRSVVTRPMYWTSIALLTVVREVVRRGASRGQRQVSWTKPSPPCHRLRWSDGCRLVELRGFEPRTFSLRRRSRPHRSPVYALHELRADRHGAPVPSAGGTGGARQSLPGGRAWSAKRFDLRTLCSVESRPSPTSSRLGPARP